MKRTMMKAALSAGDILQKYYGKKLNIGHKKEKGMVSQADKQAEQKILSILLKKFNYNVVAEESGDIDNNSEYSWVIDPIDGTTNYLRQIPFFCVSIALLYKQEPEAAVIYQPITKELFYAERGKGAFLNNKELILPRDRDTTNIIDCNLGYSAESVQNYLDAIKNVLPNHSNIRNFGSSALELAYLAARRVDCFITYGDELYDIAAGMLIAKETGCKVTNWSGNSWNFAAKDLLVAPPMLHEVLVNHLNRVSNDI